MKFLVGVKGRSRLPNAIRESLNAFGLGDPIGSAENFAESAVLLSEIETSLRPFIPELPPSGRFISNGHLEIAKVFAVELAYFEPIRYELQSVIRVDNEVATLVEWCGVHRPTGTYVAGHSEVFWHINPLTGEILCARKVCKCDRRATVLAVP